MKIREKLGLGFFIIFLLLGIIAYTGFSSMKSISNIISELNEDAIPGAIEMVEILATVEETRGWTSIYILRGNIPTGDGMLKDILQESMNLLEIDLERYKEYELKRGKEDPKIVEEFENKIKQLNSAISEIINLKDQGTGIDELLGKVAISVRPIFLSLKKEILEHKEEHIEKLEEAENNLSKTFRNTARNMLILIFVSLFISTGISIILTNKISKPLHQLHKGTEEIEKGNLDYKTKIKTKDEIGQLSKAFDKMTEELKKSKTSLEKEVNKRTKELNEKVEQLEKFQKFSTGREKKMMELKEEIKKLKETKK